MYEHTVNVFETPSVLPDFVILMTVAKSHTL